MDDDMILLEKAAIEQGYKRYDFEINRYNSISNTCNFIAVCISILLPVVLSISYYLLNLLGYLLLFKIELIVFSIILFFILFGSLILLFATNLPRNTVTFSSPRILYNDIKDKVLQDKDLFDLEFNNLSNIISFLEKNSNNKMNCITSAIILLFIFIGLCVVFTFTILIEYFIIF